MGDFPTFRRESATTRRPREALSTASHSPIQTTQCCQQLGWPGSSWNQQDESVANVPQRCGSDNLHEELEKLTKIVEVLGGRTRYTDDEENASFGTIWSNQKPVTERLSGRQGDSSERDL
jgi:hypothetical protein